MWLPQTIIEAVNEVASIDYVNRIDCERWNKYRREGELRMLTGYSWTAKNGQMHRYGFKTPTVAYRDAYYALVAKQVTPSIKRPKLRLVRSRRAA